MTGKNTFLFEMAKIMYGFLREGSRRHPFGSKSFHFAPKDTAESLTRVFCWQSQRQ